MSSNKVREYKKAMSDIGSMNAFLNLCTRAESGEPAYFKTMFPAYRELADRFDEIVVELPMLDKEERNESIEKLLGLREFVARQARINFAMDGAVKVAAYVIFRRTHEESSVPMDNVKKARQIYETIVNTNDNMLINTLIPVVTSKLPLRITRDKLFDSIREALSRYTGFPLSNARDFLDNLKDAAGINIGPDYYDSFPDVMEEISDFLTTNPSETDPKEFWDIRKKVARLIDTMEERQAYTFSLAQSINGIIAALIAVKDEEGPQRGLFINEEITDSFLRGYELYKDGNGEEFEDEGIYDALSDENLEYIEGWRTRIRKISLAQEFDSKEFDDVESEEEFKLMTLLVSDSVFANLTKDDDDDEIADTRNLEELFRDFKSEFDVALVSSDRLARAARMSGIIALLKPLFNSLDEFWDYLSTSLISCKQEKEKEYAVREILNFLQDEIKWAPFMNNKEK